MIEPINIMAIISLLTKVWIEGWSNNWQNYKWTESHQHCKGWWCIYIFVWFQSTAWPGISFFYWTCGKLIMALNCITKSSSLEMKTIHYNSSSCAPRCLDNLSRQQSSHLSSSFDLILSFRSMYYRVVLCDCSIIQGQSWEVFTAGNTL